MKRVIITIGLVMLGVVLFFSSTPAQAEIIKIGLTGVVDTVSDPYSLLKNQIQQGYTITGFYTYDSLTPNSSPWPLYVGWYHYTTAPYGISLTISGITFQTDPSNIDFRIHVTNNFAGDPVDVYNVGSSNNIPLANGITIDGLGWQLTDDTGVAFSSTELPLLPPDLSKWQSNGLSIGGGLYPFPPSGDKTLFGIDGHVTDVYIIPEPVSLCFLALGGLILRRNCRK